MWWTSWKRTAGAEPDVGGAQRHRDPHKGTWAATPEGRIVRMADQIAYVNHDIEDAVRAGVLDPATLPKDCTAVLGQTKSAASPP